jgi:signal transduction histidine kinase
VLLEYKLDYLTMRIEDDGKGFDVSKLTSVDDRGRGGGVFGMKERVKLMGGVCNIDSEPGQGTKINVRIPLTRSVPIGED